MNAANRIILTGGGIPLSFCCKRFRLVDIIHIISKKKDVFGWKNLKKWGLVATLLHLESSQNILKFRIQTFLLLNKRNS